MSRRDCRVIAALVVWVAVVLGLDSRSSLAGQLVLGGLTWALLIGLLARETVVTRLQVAVVVLFASVIEYTCSGWLGVYTYRLHNVPSFVPPGHGLVYLSALTLARSALAERHRWRIIWTTLVVDGIWVVWGLTATDRFDTLGAFWFLCLVAFMVRGRAPLVYCGAFLITSYLEIVGTSLGNWRWGAHDPTGLLGIGNPPSGIAGGYCWFDAAALAATPALTAWLARRQARRLVAAVGSAGLAEPVHHSVMQVAVAAEQTPAA